jgi:LacI family transcriptional regulator
MHRPGATARLPAIVRGARPHTQSLPSRLVVRGSTAHRRRNRTSPAWATTKVKSMIS